MNLRPTFFIFLLQQWLLFGQDAIYLLLLNGQDAIYLLLLNSPGARYLLLLIGQGARHLLLLIGDGQGARNLIFLVSQWARQVGLLASKPMQTLCKLGCLQLNICETWFLSQVTLKTLHKWFASKLKPFASC